MIDFKSAALAEYNSGETTAHHGGAFGRPFWNANATQFTYVPAFSFPVSPLATEYLFTATDCEGKRHSFTAKEPTELLTPIWGNIATGMVTLTVEALNPEGKVIFPVGARTFYKCAPFPGRDAYPAQKQSFLDCAKKGFHYVLEQPYVRHFLTHGVPDPNYSYYVYPSKMISAIIKSMVTLSRIDQTVADEALLIAEKAADYLLSIRFPAEHPMEGLPPTYSFDGLDEAVVNDVARAAQRLKDTVMMIYPVEVGLAFLALAKATKDEKYFRAAMVIANFYKNNRTPKGSWPLVYDSNTGKPLKDALCIDFQFVDFFRELYEITLDEAWKKLSEDYLCFFTETCLKEYKWEGQFEDSLVAGNYRNLTHYPANALIGYLTENKKGDAESIEIAKDLMRFVEDQFVVWGEFAYWSEAKMDERHTPAG
ncbi:MAG: hypothetical protein II297_03855, partial [Clostridia bacterium]|nr:hypothetical protein [Clostridia bacterium]